MRWQDSRTLIGTSIAAGAAFGFWLNTLVARDCRGGPPPIPEARHRIERSETVAGFREACDVGHPFCLASQGVTR